MGALGSLLGGLGGPREPWPGSLADHGREVLYPPPGETLFWTPHPYAHFQLEKGDGTTGKREKYHKKN